MSLLGHDIISDTYEMNSSHLCLSILPSSSLPGLQLHAGSDFYIKPQCLPVSLTDDSLLFLSSL